MWVQRVRRAMGPRSIILIRCEPPAEHDGVSEWVLPQSIPSIQKRLGVSSRLEVGRNDLLAANEAIRGL